MAGRIPKLNWTPCFNQFTCTIDGVFHRLGKDQDKAERQFRFLLAQSERGVEPDPNIDFKSLTNLYLDFVKEHHTPERYRHCQERLQSFKDFLGEGFLAKDIRPKHVNDWLATRGKVIDGKRQKPTKGTERLYKAIILAALNWAARPTDRGGGQLIPENPIKGKLHLPVGGSRGKEAVWKQETFDQVLRVASPAFCDLVRFLAWTGARPSLAIRLEARHFNRAQSRFDCEELQRGQSRKKMTKYIRLLNDEVRGLVERLIAERETGPLFRNSYGNPWDPDAPQIYLTNLRKKFINTKGLDWPKTLTVKGLRHLFATRFLEQHPNEIEFLRILLGHVDYRMILAHYSHTIDMDHQAFKRLDGFSPVR